MFWVDLGEKCIIVQFLGVEKTQEKALNAETQRAQRKIRRKSYERFLATLGMTD
jgi:hypothetical protein